MSLLFVIKILWRHINIVRFRPPHLFLSHACLQPTTCLNHPHPTDSTTHHLVVPPFPEPSPPLLLATTPAINITPWFLGTLVAPASLIPSFLPSFFSPSPWSLHVAAVRSQCWGYHLSLASRSAGDYESTFAPLVVLVIHVNIHIVGLTSLSSIFQISSIVAWQGHEDVYPFKMLRTWNWQSFKTLHFLLSDPRSHWVHRKANSIKRGWGVA